MKSMNIALGLMLFATVASAESLKVDTKASKIAWVGKKVTGQHNGSVDIKKGSVMVEKGLLTGGQFEVDMTSIKVLDLEGESNGKLAGHLKSDDFFGVEKHPIATFTIKNVKDGVVSGDLTIKGITNPLAFPADIKISKGKFTAMAKDVKIDRTLYDVRYGSGKFFDNLGDKVIYDEFILDLSLIAGK
jgi:polyisoprenoid-binding protein YceI